MTGLIRSCLVRMSRAGALSALLAGALLGATAAHAASFDAEYVFGDSLSDNGNAAEAGGAAFPFPRAFMTPSPMGRWRPRFWRRASD